MKLTLADITPNRLTFQSHKNHNPHCDILELTISQDACITYCIDLTTGTQSMEYYSGANYMPNSNAKSTSFHYREANIPKKYRAVWNGLKEYYNKHFK